MSVRTKEQLLVHVLLVYENDQEIDITLLAEDSDEYWETLYKKLNDAIGVKSSNLFLVGVHFDVDALLKEFVTMQTGVSLKNLRAYRVDAKTIVLEG